MSDIPQSALDAVDAALAALPSPPRPQERDRWRTISRIALNAAAPHIAAAERERIHQLALDRNARYIPGCGPDCRGGHQVTAPFAGLLTEAP